MKAIDGIISSEKGILTRGRRFDLLLTSESLFVIDGSLTGLRFDSSNEEHFSPCDEYSTDIPYCDSDGFHFPDYRNGDEFKPINIPGKIITYSMSDGVSI